MFDRFTAFQSTPSGGKATYNMYEVLPEDGVSIHAFRGEGDAPVYDLVPDASTFQSTPSGGKAT